MPKTVGFTALYERLSRDDNLVGESNSITNQKKYLEDYARKNGFTNIKHFTDDGYSGVNFNRPGFQSLVSEIKAGNVNTLIVKDMSRLGRNYLEVGFYTEVLFPQKNVRFLAINNSIDSDNQSNNDFAPFLNIMNEWYAKDTSNKIRTIFNARMQDGKRCSGSIPYGYSRVPGDKQKIVVDPAAAKVIKHIFLLASLGKSEREIANLLTEEKTLNPSAYKKEYNKNIYNGKLYSDPYLWHQSTISEILNRQEYLGHTILHKTVVTNFKLHKTRNTTPEEQYFFKNTHEPIISQELWDKVHKIQSKIVRHAPYNSHHQRLSGYVYCADCGRRMTLQTSYSKKDNSPKYSFRCGGYVSKVHSCSPHSILADKLEILILTAVQRISRLVFKDEEKFATELQTMWKTKQETNPKNELSELKRFEKRYDDISNLVRGLYENLINGLLPERQYKQLMKQYDDEQSELEEKIKLVKKSMKDNEFKTCDIKRFSDLIKKYKEPKEITDQMIIDLIDKIVVYEAEGRGKNRIQKVDIHFNFVGPVDISYSHEELKELKIQEEQEEKKRIEQQRKREKAYRERRKAERIAANGGETITKKICPFCGKEFIPSSNRQIFCSKECRYNDSQNKKKYERENEKGQHYYNKKICTICGKEYWPTSSKSKFCSSECKAENHRQKQLAYYYNKNAMERENAIN